MAKYKVGDTIKITDLRFNTITSWHVDRIENLEYVMTGMLPDGTTQKDNVPIKEMETYLSNAVSNGIAKISVTNDKKTDYLPYALIGGGVIAGLYFILKK